MSDEYDSMTPRQLADKCRELDEMLLILSQTYHEDANSLQARVRELELESHSIPVDAPTDNGIDELDDLCGQFNRGEINLSQLICTVWNKGYYAGTKDA